MDEKRRQQKQQQTRQQILLAARQLAAQGGRPALTVRQVAKQAGLAPSVLYYYFETSQQIIEAVCRQAGEEAAEAVQRAVRPQLPFGQNFLAAWQAILQLAWQRPGEYRLLSQLARQQGGGPGLEFLTAQLSQAMAAGQVRAGDAGQLAAELWAAIQGLICLLCGQGGEFQAAAERLEGFLALLLRGMAPGGEA